MNTEQKALRQEQRRNMMLTMPIPKLIPKMAVPTIVSMLVMSFYNMADTYFVSFLGDTATGAVGVNMSLMSIIQMAGMAIAMGANSYIARLLGAKKDEEATQVLSSAFFTAFFLGCVAMVGGLLFMDPLMHLLGAEDPGVLRYSRDYASFILFAAPCMAAQYVLNQCLRAEGSATYSMIGMVSGAFINLILDPIFIFGLKMEVKGAAVATALSSFVGFLILLVPYLRHHTLLHISIRKFRYTKTIVAEITKMGFPTLMRNGLMTIATIITNNVASGFSVAALAAISVVNRIMMFVTSAILGFGQGYQPVAGFCWGAKRYNRLVEAFRFSSIVGVVGISIFSLVVGIFAPQIMGFFSTTPETIRVGAFSIRLQCLVMPIHAWVIVVNMTFAGVGRAIGAALLSLSRQGICFIPVVAVLPLIFEVDGLAAAQAVADALSFLLAFPLCIRLMREVYKLMRENHQTVGPFFSKGEQDLSVESSE